MIVLPQKFVEILNQDTSNYYKGAVYTTCSKFDQIFSENRLYFFEEYTDHGIRHINSVLQACANLITPDTYKLLSEKDISILVLSVFLHDLGMHLQPLTFKKMVTGGYDDVLNADFGDQPWAVLWENYLFEAKKFNDQQRINIFGDAGVDVTVPDLNNPDLLTGVHRKLIGEFIRRHHPRIAFEVAFKGLDANDGTQIDFCSDFDHKHKLLAGLLARSHGMNIRDTFSVLEKHFTKRVWRRPINVHIVYLMSLLRLADYFQIDTSRVLKVPYLTRMFKSPVSFAEHQKHLQTTFIQETDDDPETLFITAEPSNSIYFIALERLFNDIQKEVDNSWAVLGEVYGTKQYEEQPKLAYRRVRSNIDDRKSFGTTVSYIPENISFTVDREVPKLLVGPLYDNDPSFGIRELLQNAVDACWEREFYEKERGYTYDGAICVKIEQLNDQYVCSVTDNGKGMTLDEIKNYFLKVGGSFRKSQKWQHDYLDKEGRSKVNKSGRFGIGVLAAYLLGNEIEVKTRSIFSSVGYIFKTKLEQEQIDIIKSNNVNIGTCISIIVPQKLYESLLGIKPDNMSIYYNYYKKVIRFDEWYVFKSPSIKYIIAGVFGNNNVQEYKPTNEVFSDLNEINIEWHEIKDENFKKILWSYRKPYETIICNGFIIPNKYSLKALGLYAPALVVFDNDAKLPLNLSRTSIDYPLPFIDKLEVDIYKDIIAAVLVKEVGNIFITHDFNLIDFSINHPAFEKQIYDSDVDRALEYCLQIIFGKAGFYLNHSAFTKQLLGLNHLWLFTCDDEVYLDDYVNKKYLFEDSDVDLLSFSEFSFDDEEREYVLERVGSAFVDNEDICVLGWSDNFNSLEFDDFENVQNRKGFIEDIKNKFLDGDIEKSMVSYFKYINPTLFQDAFGYIVFELLGDDLLIPYNIEDRKKKFPKAFKELEPFMRKYIEKK